MNHSPQQTAFFETARQRGSYALMARAGSGKTYSLTQWAKAARGTGIATSFSRETRQELGKKMPSRFKSMTMHSAGRTALINGGLWETMDTSKSYNLLLAYTENNPLDKSLSSDVMCLVSAAKTNAFGVFHNPTEEDWADLAEFHDLVFTDETYNAARTLLQSHVDMSLNQKTHDYDDMLYIPVLQSLRLPQAGILIVDEAQDLSNLQHEMLSRMLMKIGRVIAAGDDRQAIYAFRGALSDSFGFLVKRFNMQTYPLTVSYRCPQEVVLVAQQYVPDIEPAPEAIQGSVIHHGEIYLGDLPRQILCRNNAPLVNLALRLITSGHSAEVAGKDIGKGLISLVKRISKRNLSSEEFIGRLQIWAEKEIARKPRSKARVIDKVATLNAIANTQLNMRGITDHLARLYPDPKARNYRQAEYHLSTIHKAKGLEWPIVGILDAGLMPSKYASQDWELLQEDNLAYVACTRAQQELHFLESDLIVGD